MGLKLEIFQSSWSKISNTMLTRGRIHKFIPIAPALSTIAALGFIHSRNPRPIFPNLETIYQDLSHKKLDTLPDNEWDLYLEPNEAGVQAIAKILKTGKKGIIVSTGTERAFFDLLLRTKTEPENSIGLIIIDVNPKAIAYAHMVILLLRIADDVTDFSNLSGPNRATKSDIPSTCITPLPVLSSLKFLTDQEIENKISCIREKILKSNLSEENKKFYLENLPQFAQIYFQRGNEWRLCDGGEQSQKHWKSYEYIFSEVFKERGKEILSYMPNAFKGVQYQKEASSFKTLQSFAKSGGIVPINGDINNLDFLRKLQEKEISTQVSVIDLSNIDEYVQIDLNQSFFPFSPRVIWTQRGYPTKYLFYDHDPSKDFLTTEEKLEFDSLFEQLLKIGVLSGFKSNLMFRKKEPFTQSRPFGYYPEHLKELRDYMKQWVVTLPNIGTISFGPTLGPQIFIQGEADVMNTGWIYRASNSTLLNLVSDPQIQKFSSELVKIWREKELHEKYFLFSDVIGWKEAFMQERDKHLETQEWKEFERINHDKICRIIPLTA